MLKDIYVEHGWYANDKLTLLRNDNKEIPIDLKRKFTWYYNDLISAPTEEQEEEPVADNESYIPAFVPEQSIPTRSYNVETADDITGGTISVPDTVQEGTSVVIVAKPELGKELESMTITTGDTEIITRSSKYIVLNAAGDIQVTAVFKDAEQQTDPDQPEQSDDEEHIAVFDFTKPSELNPSINYQGQNYYVNHTRFTNNGVTIEPIRTILSSLDPCIGRVAFDYDTNTEKIGLKLASWSDYVITIPEGYQLSYTLLTAHDGSGGLIPVEINGRATGSESYTIWPYYGLIHWGSWNLDLEAGREYLLDDVLNQFGPITSIRFKNQAGYDSQILRIEVVYKRLNN